MVYVLYKSPTSQIMLGDSNISAPNNILPISLYGHDYVGEYGQVFQNNLYSMLENFSSGDVIPKPVAGMLWYDRPDTGPGVLKIYTTDNKWKKIEYTSDVAGHITITGAKAVGKQLLATLAEENNPVNISWAWTIDGVTFTPASGTILNQITCTIVTTVAGIYRASVTYKDDFNSTPITLSYAVAISDSSGVSDSAGSLTIQPDTNVYTGTPLVATLSDSNGPAQLKWTWTDSNGVEIVSVNKGLTSTITPDAASTYTAYVQYYDDINLSVPASLTAQVIVDAKTADFIGYVTITGTLKPREPLIAELTETDTITGSVVWVWTRGGTILTGSIESNGGMTSTYTPLVAGTYVAQAIYNDAAHVSNPAKPQAQAIVAAYDINTPISTTTTTTTTTTAPTSGDCGNCATDCCCCCCSGVSLPCDSGAGTNGSTSTTTSHTTPPSGSSSTSTTTNANGGSPSSSSTTTSTTTHPSSSSSTTSTTTNANGGSSSSSSTTSTTTRPSSSSSTTSTTTTSTTTTSTTTTTTTTIAPTASSKSTRLVDGATSSRFIVSWVGAVDLETYVYTFKNGVCNGRYSLTNSSEGLITSPDYGGYGTSISGITYGGGASTGTGVSPGSGLGEYYDIDFTTLGITDNDGVNHPGEIDTIVFTVYNPDYFASTIGIGNAMTSFISNTIVPSFSGTHPALTTPIAHAGYARVVAAYYYAAIGNGGTMSPWSVCMYNSVFITPASAWIHLGDGFGVMGIKK